MRETGNHKTWAKTGQNKHMTSEVITVAMVHAVRLGLQCEVEMFMIIIYDLPLAGVSPLGGAH